MRVRIDRRASTLGIGPDVTVRLESLPGAARAGEALAVFRALDAVTHQMYETISGGPEERGDVEAAELLVAARCLAQIENLDLERLTGSTLTAGKPLRRWLAGGSNEAKALAHALVPAFLDASLPDQLETDALELAAYMVLDRQNGRNPYSVGSHREGCERDIWEDRELEILRTASEVGEACEPCLSDRALYRDAIKETGSSMWVDVARRSFALSRQLEQFPQLAEVLSARSWIYIEIVRGELEKRRIYNDWEAGERVKEAGKKK